MSIMSPTIIIVIIITLTLGIAFIKTLTTSTEDGTKQFYDDALEQKSSPNISLEQFKQKVITELSKRDLGVRVVNGTDGSFKIHTTKSNDEEIIVDVNNIYSQYLGNPEKLEDYVFKFVDLGMESIANARGIESEISLEQLSVVLRHKDYAKDLDDQHNVYSPFYGDLIALLVFYYPNFVANTRVVDLKKLEIDEKEAWSIAAENLQSRYNDLEVLTENQGTKWITADSGLATGHLWLLTQSQCNQNFNAIVVNKGAYVFADMNDNEATDILAGYAANLIKKRDTLSDNLISCLDGYFYASYFSGEKWLPIEP